MVKVDLITGFLGSGKTTFKEICILADEAGAEYWDSGK
jgi:G3E family GTPase